MSILILHHANRHLQALSSKGQKNRPTVGIRWMLRCSYLNTRQELLFAKEKPSQDATLNLRDFVQQFQRLRKHGDGCCLKLIYWRWEAKSSVNRTQLQGKEWRTLGDGGIEGVPIWLLDVFCALYFDFEGSCNVDEVHVALESCILDKWSQNKNHHMFCCGLSADFQIISARCTVSRRRVFSMT